MRSLPGAAAIRFASGPALRLYARCDRFLLLNLPIVWRTRVLLAVVLACANLLCAWLLSRSVPDQAKGLWSDDDIDGSYDRFAFATLGLCAIWAIRQLRTPVGDLRFRAHLGIAGLNALAVSLLLAGPVLLGARTTERTAGVMTRASLAEDVGYFNTWLCSRDLATEAIEKELPSLRRRLAVYGFFIRDAPIGPPPSALVFSQYHLPLVCFPESGVTERIAVVDASGYAAYNGLVSAFQTIAHQQSLRDRGLAWTQHAAWRTAATLVAVLGLGLAALLKPRRRRGSMLALGIGRRFSLRMPRLLARLDRRFVLTHPWLWLFRPHVLLLEIVPWVAAGVLGAVAWAKANDAATVPVWAASWVVVPLFGLRSVVLCVRRVNQFRTPLLQTAYWLRMTIVGVLLQFACVLAAVGAEVAMGRGKDDVALTAQVEGLALVAVASSVIATAATAICNAFDVRSAILSALIAGFITVVSLGGPGGYFVFGLLWIMPVLAFRFTASFRNSAVAPPRWIQLWAKAILSTGLVAVAVLGAAISGALGALDVKFPGVIALVLAVLVQLGLIRPALDVMSQVACRPRP